MQKIFLVLFVGVLGVFIGQQVQGTPIVMNDVLLENVEALADMENSVPINCQGDGEITCPIDNRKCAFVFKGYSLR